MARKKVKKEQDNIKAVKNIMIGIMVVAAVVFTGDRLVWFFYHADIFSIKEVQKEPSLQFIQSNLIDQLPGTNIFSVDIKSLQRRFQVQFPEVDRLRVNRKFPDAIVLSARKREPFAILTNNEQDVLLDRDGYILSLKNLPSSRYPLIAGYSGQNNYILGRPLRDDKVQLALKIISEVDEQQSLTDWPLKQIDIGNLSQINLLFTNDLKIILDRDRIPQKVKTLAVLLKQGNFDIKNINYIDLRLKDPVISYLKQ
jgi:cell division septal protein FtsQ